MGFDPCAARLQDQIGPGEILTPIQISGTGLLISMPAVPEVPQRSFSFDHMVSSDPGAMCSTRVALSQSCAFLPTSERPPPPTNPQTITTPFFFRSPPAAALRELFGDPRCSKTLDASSGAPSLTDFPPYGENLCTPCTTPTTTIFLSKAPLSENFERLSV